MKNKSIVHFGATCIYCNLFVFVCRAGNIENGMDEDGAYQCTRAWERGSRSHRFGHLFLLLDGSPYLFFLLQFLLFFSRCLLPVRLISKRRHPFERLQFRWTPNSGRQCTIGRLNRTRFNEICSRTFSMYCWKKMAFIVPNFWIFPWTSRECILLLLNVFMVTTKTRSANCHIKSVARFMPFIVSECL